MALLAPATAAAKPTKTDKTNAAQECRAERGTTPATREAFRVKYGTNRNGKNAFGKCVSQKAKAAKQKADEADAAKIKARKSAAKDCAAERKTLGREAFAAKYGTNKNKRNAFGKCVSKAAKAKSATAVAKPDKSKPKPNKAKGCKKPSANKGFVVKGTLDSFTADNPATAANEESVTLTVTKANRHAKLSGELADQDAAKAGVQVKGATFSADGATDTNGFRVKLVGYGTGETPAAGDKVSLVGKISVAKAKCAPAGTSTADRYGKVNVRKVKIKDAA